MKLRSPGTVRRGFTLIELLLVIGIIAILASIVIVAINPTRQLGQARDAQRRSDVNTILNAVYQYSIDNNGRFPGSLSGTNAITSATICQRSYGTAACSNTNTAFIAEGLTGSYLVSMPQDPSVAASGTGYTGYYITKTTGTNGRITVSAPKAEQTAAGISVTR